MPSSARSAMASVRRAEAKTRRPVRREGGRLHQPRSARAAAVGSWGGGTFGVEFSGEAVTDARRAAVRAKGQRGFWRGM